MQAAYVVGDLEASVSRWVDLFGAGPFYASGEIEFEYQYRGAPAHVRVSGAIGQYGDLQIELIQQHCERPSLYRDLAAGASDALHHMAILANDVDATARWYEEAGLSVASRMEFGGMRVAHIDARAALGFMVELMQEGEMASKMLALTRRSSLDWNGIDPLRNMNAALLEG
ncbi:MAG: VOC family protein [Rhodospirillales bacterium]|nr:VOC family protein [Rhodospirillales bacterium]